MTSRMQANSLLHHLRDFADRQSANHSSDRELLLRFTDNRDEAAFRALVIRHGPMVQGVCHRVLGEHHAVDDVFQATFLVLIRRADSIRQKELLANWLYGVAYRLASRAKVDSAIRRNRESKSETRDATGPVDELASQELSAVLDEELSQLSDGLRSAFLLCYVEGLTRDQAAEELGLSVRTLHRRLERSKELLRVRLQNRGVTLSGAMLGVFLTEETARTSFASSLVAPLVEAAILPHPEFWISVEGLSQAAVVMAKRVSWTAVVPKIAATAALLFFLVLGTAAAAIGLHKVTKRPTIPPKHTPTRSPDRQEFFCQPTSVYPPESLEPPFIVSLVPSYPDSDEKKFSVIKVVKTWGELRKQKLLVLEGSQRKAEHKVRLGIETESTMPGSGVLVYALFDNQKSLQTNTSFGPDSLGPLTIHLTHFGTPEEPKKLMRLRDEVVKVISKQGRGAERVLYVGSVQTPEPGRYRVEVRHKQKRVGEAVLTVSKREFHPWLILSSEELQRARKRQLGEPLREKLELTACPGVPRFDGGYPFAFDFDGKKRVPAKTPLPGLLPHHTRTHLELKCDGRVLDVTSKTPIFTYGEIDSKILTRWWVNGKPFRPVVGGLRERSGLLKTLSAPEKRVQIELASLKALGAKPGDRIAVQVLFCPGSWEEVARDRIERLQRLAVQKTIRTPLLSNKVEFVVQ
ncbi:MAG: RNA polymerase sigma factor [Gemmataceae bacterium]